MNLDGIKNIIFDFGGVLVNLKQQTCIDQLTALGFEGVEQYLTPYGHKDAFGAFENGDIDQETFLKRVRESIRQIGNERSKRFSDEELEREIEKAWFSAMGDVPYDKIRLVYALSRKYHLFLLSNTNPIHRRALAKFEQSGYPLEECFEKSYYSYIIRYSKPGKEIFNYIIQDSGVKPEETLLIDDGPANCATARELGLRTFQPETSENFCREAFPEIMQEVDSGQYDRPAKACVATMGFFDGVHQGHKDLISKMNSMAVEKRMPSLLISFQNHPKQIVGDGRQPGLLTDNEERLALLKAAEPDRIEMLDFTPQLARLSAEEFMKEILVGRFHVKYLLIGYDHHFGKRIPGKEEGLNEYRQYGRQCGIEVISAGAPSMVEGTPNVPVSSSEIRRLLEAGRITEANQLLGYPYCLNGYVKSGFENGHKLGFPTANIQTSPEKLIPKDGAYAVQVGLPDLMPGRQWLGMLNIGCRPTLHNGPQRSIEVHFFDFNQDIYGQAIQVRFLDYLRPETTFGSTEELARQLQNDKEAILKKFRD